VAGVGAMILGALLIYFVFSTKASSAASGNRIVPTPAPGGGFDPTLPSFQVGTDLGSQAATLASSQVGKRYLWGALTDPTLATLVYDCSSLVQSVFLKLGNQTLAHARTSQQQAAVTTPVSSPAVGDLVFGSFSSPNDHVGIYMGGGQVVSALDEAAGVVLGKVANWPGVHFGRVA
jgi:uncharacterized protein YycO